MGILSFPSTQLLSGYVTPDRESRVWLCTTLTVRPCALLLLATLATPALWAQPARTNAARTNVVLIMADDLGYETIGANGGTSYTTPNLDRMAREGMRFTHAYSQPQCTPSRVKLMTGKYNWRNYSRFGNLGQGERTFAHLLKEAGYATAMTGKWQLSDPGTKKRPGGMKPGEAGFDEHMYHARQQDLSAEDLRHYRSVGRPRNGPTSGYWHPAILKNGSYLPTSPDDYGPDMFTDFAIDFIKSNKNGPFFLYYPMILTHSPWVVTPDSTTLTARAKFVSDDYRQFPNSVAYADHLVGRLVKTLDDLGIGDDTLVLFTADNGTSRHLESRMGQQVFRGGKGRTTDAGTHVPLLARWKGTTKGGTVCDDLIDFSDFLATLADLAGQRPAGKVDGRSFLSQLRGQASIPRDWLFMHHARADLSVDQDGRRPPVRFSRTKRYKLYSDGRFFDVTSDREEQAPLTSLTAAAAAVRSMLQGVLDSMPPTVSAEPTDLRAVPGPNQIKLSWKAPANTGGAPITGYKIEVSKEPTGGGWRTLVANTSSAKTTYDHVGLKRYPSRRYRIRAINSVATSRPSNVAAATATAGALTPMTLSLEPSSVGEGAGPTAVTVTASLGSTSRSEATQVSVSVTAGGGGTATAGTDYKAVSGITVTIPAGQTSGSVQLPFEPADDAVAEGAETVILTGNATGLVASTATLTIADNDPVPTAVTLSLNPGSVSEGAGATRLSVSASLGTVALPGDTQVSVSVTGGTATAGTDFASVNGFTVTIPGGRRNGTAELTIQPIDDALEESSETVVLSGTATGLATGTATLTITDDDAALPVISVQDSAGGEGSGRITFTVQLAPASGREVTVRYATSGSTATEGTDYTVASGTLTFLPGETMKTIDVATVQDEVDEEDETFTLALTDPSNAVAPAVGRIATGTIRDDDERPRLRVSPVSLSADEGESLAFSVELLAATSRAVTVTYATADGTAKAGEDYVAASGSLTFRSGETEKAVEVATIQDELDEEDETFTLALGAATNAKVRPGRRSSSATIRDDDERPRLRVSPVSLSADEGESLAFSVELLAATSREVTVTYSTADGTAKAGEDYVAASGSLTFRSGETEKAVEVATIQDELDEEDETFTLALGAATNAKVRPGRRSSSATIRDDDERPRLRVSPVSLSADEGESLAFSVELLAATSQEVTVTYSTADGTAKAGEDYVAASGSLTFRSGETEKAVEVATIQDELDEEDETFTLALGAATNAKVRPGRRSSSATIRDDDERPRLRVEPANLRTREGKRLRFSVELSAASGRKVTVTYATEDGTAKAGEDYTPAGGSLTFRPGETAKAVVVATIQDKSEEEDETFTLALGEATNAKIRPGRRSATATIRDDDGAAGDQRGSPAGISIWTDELGYRPGERLRLYRAMDPKGDEGDYTVFFYRENIDTGERRYLTAAIRPAGLWEEAVDQYGRSERDFWVGRVEAVQQELIWEGTAPAPGSWHFVAELRGPEARTVLKRAHAKFVVAHGSEALNRTGVERAVAGHLTLRRDTLYSLGDRLVVKPGATLAIEPGTLVRARGPRAEIVVEPGGRIEVWGRQEAPVVMTCAAPVGRREPGCWGGLRVLGLAPVEEGEAFGGNDPHDSSGSLRYLRVEFAGAGPAGAALAIDGVGDGTRIEHVQVHASLGDGIAFRGGTAECAYCVVSGTRKDALDWAQAWQGAARHLYVQQGPEGGGAIRASGSGWGSAEAVPTLSNVTLVGGFSAERQPGRVAQQLHSGKPAIRLEDGAALAARNAVVVGFRGPAIEARDGVVAHFVGGRSSFTHAILHANRPFRNPRAQVTDGISAYVEYRDDDPDLLNIRYEPNPDPRPRNGSAALRSASVAVPPDGVAPSPAPHYVGAFGGRNWLQEWTFFGAERDYDPAVESGHR